MTFGESISTCFSKYADFNGRASRSEYWWFALFVGVIYLPLLLIAAATEMTALMVVAIIFVLACFLPQLAAAVRRLHDTGKSGAAYLISLVPFVGGIILIVWLATEGNPGANMYGELPAK